MPVSRSKSRRSGSPGPLMLTHIVHNMFRMVRPMNFKIGIRMEDDDPHQPQAPWPPRLQGNVITLSHIGRMAHKSKTNSRSITKIGKRVPPWHVLHCAPVSRSKVRVTGLIMQMHKMCQIFRTVRPKKFKVGVWMEDVDPHEQQAHDLQG